MHSPSDNPGQPGADAGRVFQRQRDTAPSATRPCNCAARGLLTAQARAPIGGVTLGDRRGWPAGRAGARTSISPAPRRASRRLHPPNDWPRADRPRDEEDPAARARPRPDTDLPTCQACSFIRCLLLGTEVASTPSGSREARMNNLLRNYTCQGFEDYHLVSIGAGRRLLQPRPSSTV